jgi:hypothetical protein
MLYSHVHIVPIIPMATGVDAFPETALPFEMTFLEESKGRAEQKLAVYICALVFTGVKASFNVEMGKKWLTIS